MADVPVLANPLFKVIEPKTEVAVVFAHEGAGE